MTGKQRTNPQARHGSQITIRQGSHRIPGQNRKYKMKDNTTTKMKCVTFPLDVFGKFRSTDTELAGEVFQYVLKYVIDGEQKAFSDPYKEMLFESLLEPIRPQMVRYNERAGQCQQMARERMKSQKSRRKKNVKTETHDESVSGGSDNVTDAHLSVNDADEGEISNNGYIDVQNVNVTSTYDNVEPTDEDVSFATFMSIYEHQDKGGFDTKSVWNRLCNEDQREAIRYARLYVERVPEVEKREWPSRFLTTRPWNSSNAK